MTTALISVKDYEYNHVDPSYICHNAASKGVILVNTELNAYTLVRGEGAAQRWGKNGMVGRHVDQQLTIVENTDPTVAGAKINIPLKMWEKMVNGGMVEIEWTPQSEGLAPVKVKQLFVQW